jgi:hypothetical protein
VTYDLLDFPTTQLLNALMSIYAEDGLTSSAADSGVTKEAFISGYLRVLSIPSSLGNELVCSESVHVCFYCSRSIRVPLTCLFAADETFPCTILSNSV